MAETTPPSNVRPRRRLSAGGGTESRTTANGRRQLWRQIGWHGQTGAFYALDEHPSRHEPGSYAPMWVLVDDEAVNEGEAAEAAIRAFDFSDFGMDDVDPNSEYAEWVPVLATAIIKAIREAPRG